MLIFGGFSGKFLKDTYFFDIQTQALTRCQQCPNEVFLFQMPTVYDSNTNGIYTCDLQRHLVYKFDERANWSTYMSMR